MIRPAPAIFAALIAAKPNPAAADYRHAFARSYLAGIEHRARTRRHRTAQYRRPVERHFGVDRNASMFVDQHLFGKGRQVEHLVYRTDHRRA